MKISLITVVRNARETITDAVRSALEQDYEEFEYLVIDGASTDGTLDILRAHSSAIDVLISEEDAGLYQAINKGIERASGEYVGLLHADDWLSSPRVLTTVADAIVLSGADAIYGDLMYVDAARSDRVVRHWRSGEFDRNRFRWGWMPAHPTLYFRRELFDRFGAYDPAYGSAADYELTLRFLYRYGLDAAYVPQTLYLMRTGGLSNRSLGARIAANRNDHRAWSANGLHRAWYTRYLKPLRKLSQYTGRNLVDRR